MSIKQAEMPKHGGRYGCNVGDVRDFIDSGWDCAEVDLGGRRVDSVYVGMYKAIARLNATGIRVARANGSVYLMREDS